MAQSDPERAAAGRDVNPFSVVHRRFEQGFERFREIYRKALGWTVDRPRTAVGVLRACSSSCRAAVSAAGHGFLSAGRCRADAASCAGSAGQHGSRRRKTISPESKRRSARSSAKTRSTSCSTISACPTVGINIALSDSATVGPMDGEILISLKEHHTLDARTCRAAAARIAEAISRDAVFFSACRHRQPGAQFRPAGADRHPYFGL